MATFVLVHGANLGGFCWRLLTPALRQAGHESYAPSLTGCGDRVHLLTPDVGLETHIQDIVNLLHYEDLDNVVLVAHSNGGAAVTGAADRTAGRVAHLVYVDAFVPDDGESLWSLVPEATRAWMERQLAGSAEPWKAPPAPVEAWVEMARAEGWSEMVARWAGQRCTPWPVKASRDALRLRGGEAFEKLPRTFVRCSGAGVGGLETMVERSHARAWEVVDLPAGHAPMLSAPRELADVLLPIAARYGL